MKKQRVKLFQNRGAQAVQLPKDCQLNSNEVLIYRKGCKVIIEPLDEWPEEFLKCLGSLKRNIPRPKQRLITDYKYPSEE